MKKFLLTLITLVLFTTGCLADELDLEKETRYQKQVMKIGFKILNANRIDKRVTFHYVNSKKVNAYAKGKSKSVVIYKGLLPYLDSENELAGIIGHEIAHNVDFHAGYFRRIAMGFAPKKYERKADIKAVDYLVKAGYDPVAMIVALNKLTGEPNWWECYASHPKGSKRLAYVYEYIFKKYPAYLIDNEYKKNIYYQNFLLTSKKDREKICKKFEKEKQKEMKKDAV